MKLFAVAISVENEFSGRVLDVSFCVANDYADAERQVAAHCKKTFKKSKDWGAWTDLETEIQEVPALVGDARGKAYTVTVVKAASN